MAVLCQHGLFVGVDRHMEMSKEDQLTTASGDALALRDYFTRACRVGGRNRWRALVAGKGRKAPPRGIDIVMDLASFAHDVPEGEAGLFYFSGHASVSAKGLVLKSFDAYDRFPDDTGVSVGRVLQFFKSQAVHDKRFVVILDCCRDGPKQAAADDIPPNVCVLYACSQGAAAFESSKGGILTRSIIESLEAIALETGEQSCSVRAVCNRLGRQLFRWRPSASLAFALYGNWADQIDLPIVGGMDRAGSDDGLWPSSELRFVFGRGQEYRDAVNRLAAAIFNWYGIPYDSPTGKMFVREHFQFPRPLEIAEGGTLSESGRTEETGSNVAGIDQEPWDGSPTDNYFFQVRIPDGCSRWVSADFLVHLVNAYSKAPQSLIMTWAKRVDFSIFKEFRQAVDGKWTGAASEFGRNLTWENSFQGGNYQGVACVLPVESGNTSVSVTCETQELCEMPLVYLLPGLRDVFDLFRSVRV